MSNISTQNNSSTRNIISQTENENQPFSDLPLFFKLKGYNVEQNPDREFVIAKEPINKEWDNDCTTLNELSEWTDENGWIGMKLPSDVSAVFIHKLVIGKKAGEYLIRNDLGNFHAIGTANGGVFILTKQKLEAGFLKLTFDMLVVDVFTGDNNDYIVYPSLNNNLFKWMHEAENEELTNEEFFEIVKSISIEEADDILNGKEIDELMVNHSVHLFKIYGRECSTKILDNIKKMCDMYIKKNTLSQEELKAYKSRVAKIMDLYYCEIMGAEPASPFKKNSTFYDFLQYTKHKIEWKVGVVNGNYFVFEKTGVGFYEELNDKQCNGKLREIHKGFRPSVIRDLRLALLEDNNRLINRDIFLNSRKTGIPFKNGVFDLIKGYLREYNEDDFFLDVVPHRYKEEINFENVEWFKNRIAEWVSEEKDVNSVNTHWFLKLLAYILFIYPNEQQIWINFYGSGSNGKSLCLDIMPRYGKKHKGVMM